MLALEDLVDLGAALRRAGAKVSIQQLLATQRLLLRLAAEGGLPASRLALASWIAPVLCTSAAEQAAFEGHYGRWLRERFEESGTPPPPPPPDTPSVLSAPRAWRSATILVSLALALALVAGIIGYRHFKAQDQGTTRAPAVAAAASVAASSAQAPTTGGELAFVQRFDFAASAPPPTLAERIAVRNLAIVAAPLLLYALWLLRWLLFRPVLQRIASRTPQQLSEVHVPGAVRKLMPSLPLRRLAQELRRRRDVASSELQLEPTVHATLARGGNFTPVRGSRVEPDYLVLIDRAGLSDHQARLAAEIVDELSRSDVLIERYEFTRDARIVLSCDTKARHGVELVELQERLPDHCVLVFGDASGCLDPRTGAPAAWTHVLASWSRSVLLTPLPVGRWGRREWTLQRLGIQVLPMDAHGLRGLMRAMTGFAAPATAGEPLAEVSAPVFDSMRPRWLERNAPAPATIDAIVESLRAELGARGLAWLASCAAYPEVHWGITLRLGAVLVPAPALFEHLLPRIARLVWFREAYVPDWLRERLLAELSSRDEQVTRTTLRAMLEVAARGGDDVPLVIAQGEPARGETKWQRLQRWWQARGDAARAQEMLRSAERDSPLRDHVFLRFLSGVHRRRIDLLAPLALLSSLRGGASLRAMLLGAAAVIASVGLAVGWPPVHLGRASESLTSLRFSADSQRLRFTAQVALEARGASPEMPVRAVGLDLGSRPDGWHETSDGVGSRWQVVAPGGDAVVFERGGALFLKHGAAELPLARATLPVGHRESRFSPDGSIFALDDGRGVTLWSIADGKFQLEIDSGGAETQSFDLDRAGMQVATLLAGTRVRIWNRLGTNPGVQLPSAGSRYETIRISDDGRYVAAVGRSGGALWNTSKPDDLPLQFLLETVSDRVAFSTDSSKVAFWGGFGGALVVGVAGVATTLEGSDGQADMAFSPDGKRLAGVDAAGVLRLWDLTTGRAIGQPQRGSETACCEAHVAFAPDGIHLARSMGTELTVWRTDAPAATPAPGGPTAESLRPQPANVAWLAIAMLLTALMIPGLAVFCGSLPERTGASLLMARMAGAFALVMLIWFVFGYSVALTPGNAFLGGLDRAFFRGMFDPDSAGVLPAVNTYDRGVALPQWLYALFQGSVASMGACLIVGGLGTRVRFAPLLVFVAIWIACTYVPLAHAFFWSGADAYADKAHLDEVNAEAGWMWRWGALDAGGSMAVVLSAGVAGLVALLYRRRPHRDLPFPSSPTGLILGASLLWIGGVGWLAGSGLTLSNPAVLAAFTAMLGVAAGVIVALLCESMTTGRATASEAAMGAVAGLVAMGAAAGSVGFAGACVTGGAGAVASFLVPRLLRRLLHGNDPVMAFLMSIACAAAIGVVAVGVLNNQALGGPGMVTDWTTLTTGSTGFVQQLTIQLKAIFAASAWSAAVSLAACVLIDVVWGWHAAATATAETGSWARATGGFLSARRPTWFVLGAIALGACLLLGGAAVKLHIDGAATGEILSELAAASPQGASAPASAASPFAQASGAQTGAATGDAAAATAGAAAPVETLRPGDLCWVLVATVLLMLTTSGPSLFFDDLADARDQSSTGMRALVAFAVAIVVWYVLGYSIAYTEGNAWVGGFGRLFLSGIFDPAAGTFTNGATYAKGRSIPELLFVAYSGVVAAFACSLLAAAFASRVRFNRLLLFLVSWLIVAYLPLQHMTLFWQGPDAYTSADVVDKMNASTGLMWQWGALDYAGGFSFGVGVPVAGLVCAWLSRPEPRTHFVSPRTPTAGLAGVSLLWLAGYGLHAGAALSYGNLALLQAATNFALPLAAALAWLGVDLLDRGRPSNGALASGGLAGLLACTTAAGNVGLLGAVFMGLAAGTIGRLALAWFARRRPGDELPALFGGLAAAAAAGVLMTGVLNNQNLGGPGMITDWVKMGFGSNTMSNQLWIQAKALAVTVAWSGVTAFAAFRLIVGRPSDSTAGSASLKA